MSKILTVTFNGEKLVQWRRYTCDTSATVTPDGLRGDPETVRAAVVAFRSAIRAQGYASPSARCQGWPESAENNECAARATRTMWYIPAYMRSTFRIAPPARIKNMGSGQRMCADCASEYRSYCREERRVLRLANARHY